MSLLAFWKKLYRRQDCHEVRVENIKEEIQRYFHTFVTAKNSHNLSCIKQYRKNLLA